MIRRRQARRMRRRECLIQRRRDGTFYELLAARSTFGPSSRDDRLAVLRGIQVKPRRGLFGTVILERIPGGLWICTNARDFLIHDRSSIERELAR